MATKIVDVLVDEITQYEVDVWIDDKNKSLDEIKKMDGVARAYEFNGHLRVEVDHRYDTASVIADIKERFTKSTI